MTHFGDEFPDLKSLLAAARVRPGMYFAAKSIRALHAMVAGIEFAEEFHHVPLAKRFGGFDWAGFERWVGDRHNPRQLTARSFTLAEVVGGSDAAGLEVWLKWYDEFAGRGGGGPEAG